MSQPFPEFFSGKKDHASADISALLDRYSKGYSQLNDAVGLLSGSKLTWKPNPQKWSIREVIHHIADTSLISMGRMNMIIGAETPPTFAVYDPIQLQVFYDYNSQDEVIALQSLRDTLKRQAALLKVLPRATFDKLGLHPEDGKMTLRSLIQHDTQHLSAHLTQIQRLKEMLKSYEG